MKILLASLFVVAAIVVTFAAIRKTAPEHPYVAPNGDQTIYQFKMKDIDGKEVDLSKYKGKVVIIVNVASKCGNTPQYADLEKFYNEYKDKGVVILGFPANNFLSQEPGSDSDIKSFCTKNYGVTFDMFSKIDVKGKDIAPLYQLLTQKELNGTLDSPVTWNFQKFIIGKDGKVVKSIAPKTPIYNRDVVIAIQDLLK